jgi:uncharacterized membrane protein
MSGVVALIGFIILGLAIAYGLVQYSRRDKRADPASERATAQVYDNYEQARREPTKAPDVLKR